jgi:T5SS/PEP-CTERM-associated repeat protein
LAVGVAGEGSLNITGGGAVSSNAGRIGREVGSTGAVVVDGHDSRWTNAGDMLVGNAGTATLAIQNSGLVGNANGNIGVLPGSSGVVNVRGAGSLWSNGVVAVGIMGRGELHIADGAVITSTNGRIGREAGSSGAATIDGMGSMWTASGVMTIGLAGAGVGTLSVTNGGEVQVVGGMTIGTQGALFGDGKVFANVANSGIVAPGASPGTLNVDGLYSQAEPGELQIELASAAAFDKLAVTGDVTLGGALKVSLIDDFVPFGNHYFDVLDWSGSLSGEFSSIDLPTLDGALVWDASQLYVNGVLSVTGPPSPADFDEDGNVDGEDLIAWQAGFGSSGAVTHTQGDADGDADADGADFLIWQWQLGNSSAPGTTAVPEPAALCLAAAALAAAALKCPGSGRA